MDNQVEEVKSKTDIAGIIGERIELKKAGRNYKASCPFHGEKTASFMVSPELQIFKCFGCGEGGDVFTFLEKFEGMEFPEALNYLAERLGIKIVRSGPNQNSDKEKVFEINTQILKFYKYMLLEHPLGKRALEYLIKDRGLKKETIEEFGLGYSPDNSLILKKFLVDKKKYNSQDLDKTGGVIIRGTSFYDRFSGRVVFPLHDHRGNPIGFAGRVLPWGRTDSAKYINSPDTIVYHKSKVLFGLNVTRANVKKKKIAIVVEGELDAISSYQAGIKNIVAVKGSALTEDQVRLLSRFAEKFILALDSDMAGDAASRRAVTIAESLGVEVKVAAISKYKDPDEAARGDIDSYKQDLIKAKSVWDFFIDSVFARYDSETGSGKAKISKEIVPILAGIEDEIVQAHYGGVVAKRLGVGQDAVIGQIQKVQKGISGEGQPPQISEPVKKDRTALLEDRLMSLAFQSDPSVLLSFEKKYAESPLNQRLIEEYRKFSETGKKFAASEFGAMLPPELFEGFSELVLSEGDEISDNPDDLKKELDLVQKELKIQKIKQELKALAAEMRDMEEKGEKEKLLKAQNKFTKLTKTLSGYEENQGGGIILMEPSN